MQEFFILGVKVACFEGGAVAGEGEDDLLVFLEGIDEGLGELIGKAQALASFEAIDEDLVLFASDFVGEEDLFGVLFVGGDRKRVEEEVGGEVLACLDEF